MFAAFKGRCHHCGHDHDQEAPAPAAEAEASGVAPKLRASLVIDRITKLIEFIERRDGPDADISLSLYDAVALRDAAAERDDLRAKLSEVDWFPAAMVILRGLVMANRTPEIDERAQHMAHWMEHAQRFVDDMPSEPSAVEAERDALKEKWGIVENELADVFGDDEEPIDAIQKLIEDREASTVERDALKAQLAAVEAERDALKAQTIAMHASRRQARHLADDPAAVERAAEQIQAVMSERGLYWHYDQCRLTATRALRAAQGGEVKP